MNAITRPPTKGAVYRRFIRVRRLPTVERKSLGQQRGVGYTDTELTRARFYRALEHLIAREIRGERLSPLMHIGFDGRAPTIVPENRHAHRDLDAINAERNTSSSPLDYLFFQSKAPLQFWEWCVGKRFEYDFQRARTDGPVTLSLDSIVMSKIERPTAEERRRRELQPFRPKMAKRTARVHDIADNRLDAMARLGRLADEISKVSFWMLEQVIGHERSMGDVARMLQADQRYVSGRFRDALTEAGAHYRMGPSASSRTRAPLRRSAPADTE